MAKTFAASAKELGLVMRARKQDTDAGRTLVLLMADALRDCEPLSHEVGNFLADALELELRQPGTIGRALGLVKPSHRPKIDDEKKFQVYVLVHRLKVEGRSLGDSKKKGDGAWSIAAEQLKISVEAVATIWKEFRRYERRLSHPVANLGVKSPRTI